MRRLIRLCFSTLLCAASGSALAANDGLAVLSLQETQAPASAPAGAAPVGAPARGQYGGGFIEALLTGGAAPQPQTAVASIASEPASEAEGEPEPQFMRQEVDYRGAGGAGNDRRRHARQIPVSDRAGRARRCATGSASGVPASNGRASSGSAASPNGRTGRRRPRCCCAGPTCRAIWRAAPIIRSAPERSISAPRSTAFTAPTSRRRSATTSRQAASG